MTPSAQHGHTMRRTRSTHSQRLGLACAGCCTPFQSGPASMHSFNEQLQRGTPQVRGGSGRAPLVANGPSLPPASNTSRQEGVPKFGVLVLLEATRNLRTCQCCSAVPGAQHLCLPIHGVHLRYLRAHRKLKCGVFHILLQATCSQKSLTCQSGIAERW